MFEDKDNAFANYIEEDNAGRAQFLWVSLFYFLMKVSMDDYGARGEGIMRQAVRDLGTERAVRKRQRSDALGLEPNLVSMGKVIDLFGEPRFSFGKQVSEAGPEYKLIQVYTCPNSNIWARLEGKKSGSYLKIGSIYCEEVHHYLYGKYDPAIQVNLCEILTKGDHLCNFRLNMSKANRRPYILPPYEKETWEDYGTDVTASIITVFGLNYYHYGRAIYDNLGESTLRKGLRAFAYCRGERMKELNRRRNRPNDIAGLIKDGDLFLDPREEMKINIVGEDEYDIELLRNILVEVLHTHCADHLTRIYYEEVFPGICDIYNPEIEVSFENILCENGNFRIIMNNRGNEKC